MNKIILFPSLSAVSMLCPDPNWVGSLNDLAKKDIPSNTPYKIVDYKSISQIDMFFRGAWIWDVDNGFAVDILKAKEMWLEYYRKARTPLLAALDIDFMKAIEAGEKALQKQIANKKQILRDITKTELPDTLEGIKNTWPEILGSNPFI